LLLLHCAYPLLGAELLDAERDFLFGTKPVLFQLVGGYPVHGFI
jgi:hypothetical protein